MNDEALKKKLSDCAPWHFQIEVRPGIWTEDFNPSPEPKGRNRGFVVVDPGKMKESVFDQYYSQGFQGKTFLDCGCNGDGYCFVAHEAGAEHAFGFDARQHWIDQADLIHAVKFDNSEKISFAAHEMGALNTDRTYDVTLFKGLFYHLADPIHELLKLCSITNELMVLNTVTRTDIPEDCLSPIFEKGKKLMSGVEGQSWYPGGPQAVIPSFVYSGFPYTRTIFHRSIGKLHGTQVGRMEVHAARNEALFKDAGVSYDTHVKDD